MKTCLRLFITCSLLWLAVFAGAQAISTETVTYNKVKYPAYTKIYDLPAAQLEDVLKATFKSRGANGTSKNGWIIYKNVVLPALGNNDPHDVYFKVEREGKKATEQSKLYAIVTRPGAISDEKPEKGQAVESAGIVLAAGGIAIFDEHQSAYENQTYLNTVKKQEEDVKKAEKKLNDLQASKDKMTKDLEALQRNLEQNQKDIQEQIKAVEAARKELEIKKNAKPGAASKDGKQ